MPRPLARAVDDLRYWFVIGGQAVRCFAPFRPSRDVDFGLQSASDLEGLLAQLERSGEVVVQERALDTVHLTWNGIKVSGFVLEQLVPFVEDRHLDITGLLATKLHAILDRGLRRDFFDLYVLLEQERLGIASLLAAIRKVYPAEVDDGLLLRALTYFDDAEREAELPGEGPQDWSSVKEYFLVQVGSLLAPPARRLEIQEQQVDIVETRARGGTEPTSP
jgi:hypothetical protein